MLSEINYGFGSENMLRRRYAPSLRGKILVLEGIISAGKSTAGKAIRDLAHSMGVKTKFFPEPLNQPLLDMFLADQKKYAFAFQMTMLCERKAIYAKAEQASKEGYFCIIDRSMHGDYCFAKMHSDRGNINNAEWSVYTKLLNDGEMLHPDYLLYLKVSPATAVSRCAKRDRKGESTYDLEYFAELTKIYNIIIEQSDSKSIMMLDWNEERKSDEVALHLLDRIREMYESLF